MRVRRVARWTALLVSLVVCAAGGWWAAQQTVVAPAAPTQDGPRVTAMAVEGSVGQAVTMGASVVSPYEAVAVNNLSGIVTRVGGGPVTAGGFLYSVGETPVTAFGGSMPFWRPIELGASGEDVKQVQQNLIELSMLSGRVDGKFGLRTEAAVRKWQRSIGVEPTGVIALGEVIAVPTLPAHVVLGEEIAVGASLSGGESAVLVQRGEPRFEMTVTAEQANRAPEGTSVTLVHSGGTWDALVSSVNFNEQGETVLVLSAPDGGPVCGAECGMLLNAERTPLTARVHIVPEVSGVSIPAAAVLTEPTGQTFVRLAHGADQHVELLATGGGVAIVDGLAVGSEVLLPGVDDAKVENGS